MGFSRINATAVLLLSLPLIAPITASAEDGRSYLAVDGGYKTGDFGTATRSNLSSLSPTIGYVAPRYDLSVTVPSLFLTSETAGARNTESGPGDLILRGGLVLVPEGERGFSVDGSLALKLPTADETRGLGTGETDFGAFLSLRRRFETIKLSLLGGYIKIGDPPLLNYNDSYLYGVGVSRSFGRTELFASYEGRRAMVPGAVNPREINAGFFHVLSSDYAIKGGAFSGLNSGGPDFGLNIGFVRWL